MSRGVLYMALSAVGFSVMALLVKIATETLPTGEIVLARAVVTLVLSYAMLRRAGVSPWGTPSQRGKLVVRGLIGSTALACYYLSLARLPLSDATTLQNTTPLVTALLAWWLLREGIGRATAFAIVTGLVGVAMIVRPFAGGPDAAGIAVALTGATASAIAYVTVRQLQQPRGDVPGESALVIVFYFPLVATPLALPWAAADFVWPDPTQWLLLIAIGAVTQLAQVFMTMGLAIERAGRATAVGYLQVCFAMLWQMLVFHTEPAMTTIAGAALIIAGTLAVSTASTRR
jgi:drug/metabolite transporter (DMT)-like permease